MKTIDIGPDGMAEHIVRFNELKPKKGNYESLGIPTEAYEMLTAKTLYTLLAPAGAAGSHQFTSAKGPDDLSLSIAECPPGDGPMLHAHMETHEIFFCLKGRFEISWGDAGEHADVLEQFDMVDVPLGVTRAFRNVGDDTALLFVIILGGNQNDVGYTKAVGDEVAAKYGPDVRDAIEAHTSMKFNVGTD
jgi:mannose-6-phosphate isomerase-like protein (cupin superfamily)